MIEAKITKKSLLEFLKNLRDEDLLELKEFLKNNTLEEFFFDCFDENNLTYFLKTKDNKPLALGGAYVVNDKCAKIWLLTTKEIFKCKIAVFKYVKNKIETFKQRFDILYNFIFISNFSSLVWLKRCGFEVLDLNVSNYKLFYFNKGENNFDLRYITC